jgi:hypothetical protein
MKKLIKMFYVPLIIIGGFLIIHYGLQIIWKIIEVITK